MTRGCVLCTEDSEVHHHISCAFWKGVGAGAWDVPCSGHPFHGSDRGAHLFLSGGSLETVRSR